MNKEKIKNLKVFAASALLASSIVLSGCSSTKTLSDYSDEEIKEEYERRNNETRQTIESKSETEVFETGYHIIEFVQSYGPFDSISPKRRIECPEGYELISTWSYRINDNKYFGYIYSNTVPVEVKSDENGEFTDFGSPTNLEKEENAKTLTKKY